jgi:hypothetical protein
MSENKHLIHLHSADTATGTNLPKMPESANIEYGEIAVNYATDKETIFIKNEDDEIVSFSSDKALRESELVISAALNDLNERIPTGTATENDYGFMSSADKIKLDGLEAIKTGYTATG